MQLWAATGLLGTKHGSPARTVRALNHWALSLAWNIFNSSCSYSSASSSLSMWKCQGSQGTSGSLSVLSRYSMFHLKRINSYYISSDVPATEKSNLKYNSELQNQDDWRDHSSDWVSLSDVNPVAHYREPQLKEKDEGVKTMFRKAFIEKPNSALCSVNTWQIVSDVKCSFI